MPDIFSICTRIVGKDKTRVELEGGRSMERWATFKNRFTNYGLHHPAPDADGNVVMREVSRADVVKLIAYHGYATAYILKDDTLKKGRSRGTNTLGARMVMVDFDNTWSLEEAMQHPWWSKVWFAYVTPSYGKLQEALDEADLLKLPEEQVRAITPYIGQPKRNFRLVFRLHRLITREELVELMAGLMDVFPLADRSCIDDARIFFGTPKARVEQPPVEYYLTEDDIQDLLARSAGWRERTGRETRKRVTQAASTAKQADGTFGPDTLFTLDDGSTWTVKELLETKPLGWKQGCFSIFRPENTPSAFVKRFEDSGNLFTFDSGSGLKYMWKPLEETEGLTFVRKMTKEPKVQTEDNEVVCVVPVQPQTRSPGYVPSYSTPLSVEARRERIRSVAGNLKRFNIFFAPEGFGKSYITPALTSRTKRVLFCCATNEQAEQKAEEFGRLQAYPLPGMPQLWRPKVQLCVSRSYLFKKATGIDVVRDEPVDPFSAPTTNKVETIELMVKTWGCKVEEAHQAWKDFYENAPVQTPDFSDAGGYRIIVTTMARAEVIAQSGAYRAMTDDWVVIYDDPGFGDVSNLVPHTAKREARIDALNLKREENGEPPLVLQRRTFGDRLYFVRPVDQRLGHGFMPFRNGDETITIPVIYTTTEEITRFLIEHSTQEVQVFDEMHGVSAENLTLWGTSLVHKKNDGIIVLAVSLLQHEFPNETIALIADGLGQRLNHINNKGQNTLSEQHIIIELSQLHPTRRAQILDEINFLVPSLNISDRDVQGIFMRDQMHQAVGRNSGYRRKGDFHTVVLCDPHYWQALRDTSRYMPTPWSALLDEVQGESARSKVRAGKRARNTLSFYGSIHPMLERLRQFVVDPKNLLTHEDLTGIIRSVIQSNPRLKPRLLEAFKNQMQANLEQNDRLDELVRITNAA